jgi:hypothetical protein
MIWRRRPADPKVHHSRCISELYFVRRARWVSDSRLVGCGNGELRRLLAG